ncbi:MAG: GNAT family N-acetyltransferase [Bacilli bacterium]|nr:GNAT family N-acetyltransferase [Bacilli bacterium]
MNSEKIARVKKEEIEAMLKCYRRCLDDASSLSKRISEKELRTLAESGDITILKENKRVLGGFYATSLWKERLFPQGLSYREEDDLLSSFPHEDERIVYLDTLFLDPSFKGKGKGKDMLLSLLHRYEDSTFFLILNENDNMHFFLRNGFHYLKTIEKGPLYVRPYQKQGICSDPSF